jgi:hypothetical protein
MNQAFAMSAASIPSYSLIPAAAASMCSSFPFKPIPVGEMTVRSVSPAEDALMNYSIRLGAASLSATRQSSPARFGMSPPAFPKDPHALNLLAEVERLAGNRDAANAALDTLLAIAPNDSRGLMQKGIVSHRCTSSREQQRQESLGRRPRLAGQGPQDRAQGPARSSGVLRQLPQPGHPPARCGPECALCGNGAGAERRRPAL